MSVWLRRSALALALWLLAHGLVAVWLAHRFDPTRYKERVVNWMKTRHDRALAIEGPITLAVFPRLEVRLRELSLSDAGLPYAFAALDEATLGVQWWPLILHRELIVDRITARGGRLILTRDAEGHSNVDDLLGAGAVMPEGERALRFGVQRLVLGDVRVRVKDEWAGIDGELVIKELGTGRIASDEESNIELLAQFGFKSPALRGELSGNTDFTPDLNAGSVRLAQMNLSYKGDAPSASSVDAQLRGNMAWNGRSGAVNAQALSIRLSANTAAARLNGSTLAIEGFSLDPARKALWINALKMRLRGTQSGKPLGLDLDWPELDVLGTTLKGSALSGRLSLGGPWPLEVGFRSEAPVGSFDSVRVPAFEARATGGTSPRSLTALLRSELVLQPVARAALLEHMTLDLQMVEPGLRPIALQTAGTAAASADGARWAMVGQLNGNVLNSEGAATFTGFTPQFKTVLRMDSLALDSLVPADTLQAITDDDTPIDLSGLRSLNGRFTVRLGQVTLGAQQWSDTQFDASIDAGMLRVSELQGRAWGGLLTGSAFADARASRVALKLAGEDITVGAMLSQWTEHVPVQGRGNVMLELDTAGRSVAELKSRLKGRFALHLRDGVVQGIDVPSGLRMGRAALPLRHDTEFKARKTEVTPFNELYASLRLVQGVAHSTDIELRSPALRLVGETALDLAHGRVDGKMHATITDPARLAEGGDLGMLRGVTVPVTLSGDVDAMLWKIQWSEAFVGSLKTQPDHKLKDSLRLKAAPPAPADSPNKAATKPPPKSRGAAR